jgi:hypothetical protein
MYAEGYLQCLRLTLPTINSGNPANSGPCAAVLLTDESTQWLDEALVLGNYVCHVVDMQVEQPFFLFLPTSKHTV